MEGGGKNSYALDAIVPGPIVQAEDQMIGMPGRYTARFIWNKNKGRKWSDNDCRQLETGVSYRESADVK